MLRNQKNDIIDDQMTYITVELVKFEKDIHEIHTDLDKLIYTMKNLHKITKPIEYPEFWNEEWLDIAIKELDTRVMTPEERLAYEMTISKNALAIYNENRKIKEASLNTKTEAIKNALKRAKLSLEEIAEDNGVSIDFVTNVQQNLTNK